MSYAFLVTLADEGVVQLESCLGFLRAAYPAAPVRVISDGVPLPGYREVCRRHRARYVAGQYLKRIECGGRWWKRFFEVGLTGGARWLVKLDPDARVLRPFRGAPPHPISGTIEGTATERENVQGGCQVIEARVARRILRSGLLDSPVLADPRALAADDVHYRWIQALAYFSTDSALGWLARNLGIEQGHWGEIGSLWQPPAPRGDFAVTHPHKLAAIPRQHHAPLRVITTCKGRLAHLKRTLPTWRAEPGVAVTVVDYDCPDGTAAWVRARHPEVEVVCRTDLPKFNLAQARNLGAAAAPPGWWCFFDADWLCTPGWATAVRDVLRAKHYYLTNPIEWGQFGSVVVHSEDYRAAGGYDELFRAWGWEDGDFYARLRHVGARPASMPGRFFSSIRHSEADRTRFYDVKRVADSRDFYAEYVRRKVRFMLDLGRLPSHADCLALLRATARRRGIEAADYLYGGADGDPCRQGAPGIVPTAPTPAPRPEPAQEAPTMPVATPESARPEAARPGAPGATPGPGLTQAAGGAVSIKRARDRQTGAPIINVSVVVQNVGADCNQQNPETATEVF